MPLKGQVLSLESIARMKATKAKKIQSKFNWAIIEPYLDVVISNGERNRKKKFITLRQFKEMILEGNSLLDIKRTGISKHLVGFFSNFCQGKIKITKEKFHQEYISGKSLDEISIQYFMNREDITYLRQLYDIKAKGATYQERKRIESPLTQRQKDILYGSMMGDAKRQSTSYNSSAGFKHGIKQKDYLMWKYKEFENVASPKSLKSTTTLDHRSGNEHTCWSFYTYANSDVETCLNMFYGKNGKQITSKILNNLSPLSIAVWYMDDGTTDFSHRRIRVVQEQVSPVFSFCTDSFSKESCENIQKWFMDKYGIKTKLRNRQLLDRMGYRILVSKESIELFLKLIEPYILPMFNYKINYTTYVTEKVENGDVDLSNIIECPIGEQFTALSLIDQDAWVGKIVKYWHSRGFESLIGNPDEKITSGEKVVNYNADKLIHNDCIGFNSSGNDFLMTHFPHFYEAKARANQSAVEIFKNKSYLTEMVRQLLIEGYFPRHRRILKKLRRYRGNKIMSGFMPCVAKAVYHKYCNKNSNVLDFCAGYGGRLFGALTCDDILSYTGVEVCFKSYLGLMDLYRSLRRFYDVDKLAQIINADAIKALSNFQDNQFDLCFTSPPYFNAEEYENNENQSFLKYSSYSEWFEEFLIKCVKESMRVSKKVLINIADTGGYKIAKDLEVRLDKDNIDFKIDKLRSPAFGGGTFYEPLFVIGE